MTEVIHEANENSKSHSEKITDSSLAKVYKYLREGLQRNVYTESIKRPRLFKS